MDCCRDVSVVIIESSEIVRERMVALVSRLGHAVIAGVAETGRQGLDLCMRCRPEVVMLGLELQEINGMKFLQQLREAHPDCRIIALTNCPFKGVLQLSLDCGADFCFDKTAEFRRALEVCEELARSPSTRPASGTTPETEKPV